MKALILLAAVPAALLSTLLVALLSVLLTGCAYQAPVPVRNDVRVILKAPVKHEDPTTAGTATYLPPAYLPPINACVITLREYPQCLLHEIRHCFEGQWHPGRKSDEDC